MQGSFFAGKYMNGDFLRIKGTGILIQLKSFELYQSASPFDACHALTWKSLYKLNWYKNLRKKQKLKEQM